MFELTNLLSHMKNDVNECQNDTEVNRFSFYANELAKHPMLKKEDRELIKKHTERYSKICKWDFKKRADRLFDNALSFMDSKKQSNVSYNQDELNLLFTIDYINVINKYGDTASYVYRRLEPNQQDRLINVLDSIDNSNITAEQKEKRKNKYLRKCVVSIKEKESR